MKAQKCQLLQLDDIIMHEEFHSKNSGPQIFYTTGTNN